MGPKKSLGSRAVAGAAWTILTGIGSRAIGLVGTVVLTYFLAREVIGEVSDAAVVTLLATQFSTLGVGQYLIAKPEAGRDVAWHAVLFHLGLGVIALGACIVFVDPLAHWMKAPALGHYLPGLALAVFLDRVALIPERLLVRGMQFRVIGLSRTAGELAYTTLSVGLAIGGLGGMAVVYANIVRSLLRLVVVLAVVPRADWLTPSPLSLATIRELLRFGLPFSLGASAGQASRKLDNLLVSSFFGAATAGVYNMAYNVADVPAVQVGEQIGDVLFPSFAHMDLERRKTALVRSSALLGLVVSPLAVGLGAIAPTLVRAFLRPEWAELGPMLTVLSVLSVTRPLGWTISAYLQARDRTTLMMYLEGFKLVCLVGFMFAFRLLGALWVCGAVGIAFSVHAIASVYVVHRLDAIPFFALLWRPVPPLVACVPMVAAVLAVRGAMQRAGLEQPFFDVAIELTVGALTYVASALLVARAAAADLFGLVGGAVRERRRKSVEASGTS
jgi:lipopolysaccharide exporter